MIPMPKPFWLQKQWWRLVVWFQSRAAKYYLKNKTCESCGAPATIVLDDMSVWCSPCDAAAERLGYNEGKD